MTYDDYKQVYGDLYEQELLLEAQAKQEAEEHLKDALEKAKREGEGGEGRLAGKLMKRVCQVKCVSFFRYHKRRCVTSDCWL